MSVLIRDMKMPKNCLECDIRSYDANAGEEYCPFSQMECLSIGRQDDCPLVELPEKHGRLIDADELKTAFPTCDNSKPILVASVRATINHMPTVIEAEGE